MKNKYPLLSNVSQMQKALKSGASSSMIGSPMKNAKKAMPKKMAPAKVQARKKKMISNAASKTMGGLYSK